MLVNSVVRGLKTSIFHVTKLLKNGYLCNSRFVKVVKRTSSLRLVDDRHSLCSAKDALNQGVTFRDSLVNVSRREVNQSPESG